MELVNSTLVDVSQTPNHALGPIVPLLLALPSQSGEPPLVATMIRHHLRCLMDGHGPAFVLNNSQPVVRALRHALILLDETKSLNTRLVGELVDEIIHQRARPLKEARESNGPIKRAALSKGTRPIGRLEKRLLDLLVKALDDPELKSQWPRLSKL